MPQQANAPGAAGTEGVRRISVPLAQRAGAVGSYDAAARTVELTIATESMVRTPGYMLGLDCSHYFEILDCQPGSVDFRQVEADNCPVLDAHARWSVKDQLGKVRGARCEGGQVVGTCHFGQSDGARAIEAEVAAGTQPKVSAGYRREQAVFERFEGETPVYRITKWTLQEASFVPVAADLDAGVRSDEQTTFPCIINEGSRTMSEQNGSAAGAATGNTGVQSAPAPALQPSGEGTRAAAGAEGVQPAPAPAPQPSGEGTRAAVTQFTATTALAFVEQARAFRDTIATRAQELVAQNGRGEISVETANSQLLAATAEAQRAQTNGLGAGGVRAEVTADERDKFMQGAANSIIQRAGLSDLMTRAAKARGQQIDLDPGEFRGVRNAELARICLERAGVRISSYDRDQIVGMALMQRAGLNTTSDFGTLLENVMHKSLQASYLVTPDTWSRFCGIGSVSDFRAHNRYLRGTFGALDDRNESGEFKNKSIPDGAKESISAAPKGNIIGLTRDAIVNDDLGAFNFLSTELGRAAKLSVEVDVYALIAANPTMNDGVALFHADHDNIAAVAAAPSVAAFDALRVAMASQLDVSGNEYLDIRPAVWLGPVSLGGNARVINGAEYDPDTANKLQKPNMVKGMFNDIVDTPRLSGTAWYGFADPNVAPAIEVVFLNGVQEPYLEQREGWRFDGTEFKVRHDYGVGALNWRSVQKNAGA